MHSAVPELGTELLSFAFYSLLTSVLAYGGVRSELSALQQFGAGELEIAVWYLILGGVALYAMATILNERLWPTVRRVTLE
jgi:hypothetical protein